MNLVENALKMINIIDNAYQSFPLAFELIKAFWTLIKSGIEIPKLKNNLNNILSKIVECVINEDINQCFKLINNLQDENDKTWILKISDFLFSPKWPDKYFNNIRFYKPLPLFVDSILPQYLILSSQSLFEKLFDKLWHDGGESGRDYSTLHATLQALIAMMDNNKDLTFIEKKWLQFKPKKSSENIYSSIEIDWFQGELRRLSRINTEEAIKFRNHLLEEICSWRDIEEGTHDILKRIPLEEAITYIFEGPQVDSQASMIQGIFEEKDSFGKYKGLVEKLIKSLKKKKYHPRYKYIAVIKLIYTTIQCGDDDLLELLLSLTIPPKWVIANNAELALRNLALKDYEKMKVMREICLKNRKKSKIELDLPDKPEWYYVDESGPTPEEMLILSSEMGPESPWWFK